MRKSKFTETQIVAILKEGEAGMAVAQANRPPMPSRALRQNRPPTLSSRGTR